MASTIRSMAACLVVVLGAVGCATSGIATGQLVTTSGGRAPVVFDWRSDRGDPTEGRMSTVLPDGTPFAGRYFEITQTVEQASLAPLWVGWDPYWPSWTAPRAGYGGTGYTTFSRIYSGRVVATLESPEGTRMRCRFTLADPPDGLAGGGVGDCQLQNGTRVEGAVLERTG
jgi:hypothetical protein